MTERCGTGTQEDLLWDNPKALARVRMIAFTLALSVGALAAPTGAGAAQTLYVSPNGLGLATCMPNDPCDAVTAMNILATSGDTVILAGDQGSYQTPMSPTNTVLHVKDGVTVTGAPGQPMPVWYSGVMSPNSAVIMEGVNSKLVDLDIEDSGSFGQALAAKGTVDRVIAHATDSGGWGCSLPTGVILTVTVTNSICEGGGAGWAQEVGGGPWNVTLRNDLLYSSGFGLVTTGGSGAIVNVNATNTIFHSTGTNDVYADGSSASLTVTADHSNYSSVHQSGATVTATNVNGNQSTAPAFANAGGGDFREAAGSPTIDAGTDSPANGSLDLAALSRTSGARTDIGPYELQVPPATSASPTGQPAAPKCKKKHKHHAASAKKHCKKKK
jgi:hypothetical protein